MASAAQGNPSVAKNNGKTTLNTPPVILWAQTGSHILLTINIEDCKDPTINLENDKLYFKGKSDSIQSDYDHSEHEVTLEFYRPVEVNGPGSKQVVKARGIELVILKKEHGWWPRLLKDSTRRHWLKVDFLKWKHEDDSDDEPRAGGVFRGPEPDFGDFMQQFGGMAGASGAGDGDLGDEDEESDDDDTEQPPPDLE